MKKNVTITLFTSEILHDIENVAYITGEAKKTGDNEKNASLMQAGEDGEDSDKIMRSVGSAYGKLFFVMSDYIDEDNGIADNAQWERNKNVVINLRMPSNFRMSVTDTIASAAHDYVVAITLSEWFAITSPEESESYSKKAVSMLAIVSSSLNERQRPGRLLPEQSQMTVYYGCLPATTTEPAEADLVRYCTPARAKGRAFSPTLNSMYNEKACYAYPTEWGDLDSIADANGYEYIHSFTKSIITLSDGQQYNCYLLTIATSMQQPTFIKFK